MQSGEKYEGEIPKAVVELIQQRMDSGQQSEPLVEGLKREGVLSALLKGLQESDGQVEYEENALRALVRAVEAGALTQDQASAVKSVWQKWGTAGQAERGFEGSDAQDVEKALA